MPPCWPSKDLQRSTLDGSFRKSRIASSSINLEWLFNDRFTTTTILSSRFHISMKSHLLSPLLFLSSLSLVFLPLFPSLSLRSFNLQKYNSRLRVFFFFFFVWLQEEDSDVTNEVQLHRNRICQNEDRVLGRN